MKHTVVKEAKRNLRRHIKNELSQITPESILEQSKIVSQQLVENDNFKRAKKIAVYMNMPSLEINTQEIIENCFNMGKQVFLPKCIYESLNGRKSNHLQMLKVDTLSQIHNLKPQGKFKLLEPTGGEDIMKSGHLDVIIIPGVAFTKNRIRLGHGAGFYDEFLTHYYNTFNQKPYLIGLGLSQQLVHQIPTEDHDWVLDCLLIAGQDPIT